MPIAPYYCTWNHVKITVGSNKNKKNKNICSIKGMIANYQDLETTQESELLAFPLTTKLSPST